MAERMHRTQILLPKEEYLRLKRAAQEEHRSVGALVREAVSRYHTAPTRAQRRAAVHAISKLRLPVSAWPEMEAEIARARARGGHEE